MCMLTILKTNSSDHLYELQKDWKYCVILYVNPAYTTRLFRTEETKKQF